MMKARLRVPCSVVSDSFQVWPFVGSVIANQRHNVYSRCNFGQHHEIACPPSFVYGLSDGWGGDVAAVTDVDWFAKMSVVSGRGWRVLLASGSYFAIVFGTGFALGAIRVVWIEPRFGKTLAVAGEMPILLFAMFAVARWLPRLVGMDIRFWPLLQMGIGALLLQQIADFAVGTVLRGISAADQLAYLTTPAGLIYLAALGFFAAMPVLVNLRALRNNALKTPVRGEPDARH